MAQLNQNDVAIATEHHSHLDLPFDHVTTASFMRLQPVFYRHMLVNEQVNVTQTIKVRPQPMPVPTFGRMRANVRHFFVPYRLVFPNWEEYFLDNIATNYEHSSLVSKAPFFKFGTFVRFITGDDGNLPYADDVTASAVDGDYTTYDFKWNSKYWKFTSEGRFFYKIFYSLGYDIFYSPKFLGDQSEEFNALALLAYVKVYLDWYANTQYRNGYDFLALEQLMKYNNPTSALELTAAEFDTIFGFIKHVCYQTNGYFEACWDNPVSPNNGQFSNFAFLDPTATDGGHVELNGMGTPEMYKHPNAQTTLGTQYLHDALKKLQQYQHRHALAGALSIDRFLSEYGFVTPSLKMQRSIYIGCSSIDINVGDVYATANGSNSSGDSVVGDFAGRSLGGGQFSFKFQNDEAGIVLSVVTIQPSGGYYQGYDRNNRHLTKKDFYNSSFDQMGVQIIEKGEVFVSKDLDGFGADVDEFTKPFGYTGRYAEYKRSISRVSGDIALPTMQAGGNSWHLMRQFTEQYFNGDPINIHHSETFSRGEDSDQFNRVFNYTSADRDPFQIELHADVSAFAPCASLTDEYDWQTTAKHVQIEVNGGKVN